MVGPLWRNPPLSLGSDRLRQAFSSAAFFFVDGRSNCCGYVAFGFDEVPSACELAADAAGRT